MVIASARLAANELLQPAFRFVLLKSVGLTILFFFALWFVLEMLFSAFAAPLLGHWPWVSTAIIWLMSAGILVGAGFLLAPVTALIAGFFLDDVAQHIEHHHYQDDEPGRAVPLLPSIMFSLRFVILVLAANLLALLAVLLPGINFAIFFLVNGYLLGREYFMFAAMRFKTEQQANALRSAKSTSVLMGGIIIACFMAVPVLNLATPVFAAALMVHLHKAVSNSQSEDF